MLRPLLVSPSLALLVLAAPLHAQVPLATGVEVPVTIEPIPTNGTGFTAPRGDNVEPVPVAAGTTAERAAERGLWLPYTQSAQITDGHAIGKAVAGYDGATNAFVARSAAEARVVPFLALRIDFEHGPGMGPDDRFGVGARVQVLNQSAQGIDGALGFGYQPNDFRQEGQLVGTLMLGRSFGRLQLFGNALFGSDAEGDDQAVEGRVSALYRVLRQLHLGVDSRFRYNMSEDAKRTGTQTVDWELQATPTASFTLGPIALLGLAGLSMLERTEATGTAGERRAVRSGVVAMAGAGGAF